MCVEDALHGMYSKDLDAFVPLAHMPIVKMLQSDIVAISVCISIRSLPEEFLMDDNLPFQQSSHRHADESTTWMSTIHAKLHHMLMLG